jgi:hypothetical protein
VRFLSLRATAGRPKVLKPKVSWNFSMVESMNPPLNDTQPVAFEGFARPAIQAELESSAGYFFRSWGCETSRAARSITPATTSDLVM